MKLYIILFIEALTNFAFSQSLQFGASMKDFQIDYGINRKLNSSLIFPKIGDITFTTTKYCGDGDVSDYYSHHPEEDYGKGRDKIDYVLGYFLVKSNDSGIFPDPNTQNIFTIDNWYAVGYGAELNVKGGVSTKLVPIDHPLTQVELNKFGSSDSLFDPEKLKTSSIAKKASDLLTADLNHIGRLLSSANLPTGTSFKYRVYPVGMACFDLVKPSSTIDHEIKTQRYSLAKIGTSLNAFIDTLNGITTFSSTFTITNWQSLDLDLTPFVLETHATKPTTIYGSELDPFLNQWDDIKSNLNYTTISEITANIINAKIKLQTSVTILINEKNQCKAYENSLANKLWTLQIPQYYLCKYLNGINLITLKSDIEVMDTSTLPQIFTTQKIKVINALAIVFNLKRALDLASVNTNSYEKRNELACFFNRDNSDLINKNKVYDFYIKKVISSQGFTLKDGITKITINGAISHPEPGYAINDYSKYREQFRGNNKSLFMGGYPNDGDQPILTPQSLPLYSFTLKPEAILIDFHIRDISCGDGIGYCAN